MEIHTNASLLHFAGGAAVAQKLKGAAPVPRAVGHGGKGRKRKKNQKGRR
jgi:hypothetical protein